MTHSFTPYPDINDLLTFLLEHIQAILGEQFVGMYLYGSLTTPDFDYDSSDIDYLVVTRDAIRGEKLDALIAMHRQIGKQDSKWATEIEASYIPLAAIRRHSPIPMEHPHIDRGGCTLLVEPHHMDWIIQRHVLLTRGIVIAGQPINTLIDPIAADELKQAVRDLLAFWWQPMIIDATTLEQNGAGYLPYAIMTMCRILYTLENGTVISKPQAAQWAIEWLDNDLAQLVKRAVENRNGTPLITIADVQRMIGYTVEQASV